MDKQYIEKKQIRDLTYFGGAQVFAETKSTSNLVQPDFERFLQYSKRFFIECRYTNNGPLVRMLEKRLAKFHDVEFCVAVCSGFWALVLAMSSL
ncbi:DegT/DnrJ/EryC1/StrS family aminotransferase, partial [Pseudomonadota bacterium]